MFGVGSLKIGKIGPIEIYVNATWLVIFGLLTYWLKVGYIAENAPGLGEVTGWLVGLVSAVLLFCSVLAHELAHSFVAVRNGLPIRRITLFIFGGIAHMESEPRYALTELKMALAGPLTSIAIGAVFALVKYVILKPPLGSVTEITLRYIMYANFVLAGFNLIPGFPLDGGRILRSIIWKLSGDFRKATRIASGIGRGFGLGLVFVGTSLSIAWSAPGLLWLVLIGSFIERLAYFSSHRQVLSRDVTVAEVMTEEVETIPSDLTIEEAVREYFATGHSAYPVVTAGELVGIISRSDVARVTRDRWSLVKVSEVMTPRHEMIFAHTDEPIGIVLRRMLASGVGRLPVMYEGRMVGIVTRTDIVVGLSGGRR